MKQNFIFSVISSFIFVFVFAQNKSEIQQIQSKTNVLFLQDLAKSKSSQFQKNKALAYQLAEANNWPKVITEGKQFSELIGVTDDLKPIYYATFNAGAGVTSRANTMYSGGSLGLSIHGEGMTSGIWDAGSAMPEHEIFNGRLTLMDGSFSTHYHAAHVAGTVIGDENVEGGLAKGMAYMADGHSYDWFDDHAEIATAAANGLILSNHSYGINPVFVSPAEWGKYNQTSQTIDQIMYNAPYYQFVSAAGNSRGNFNTGKNGYDLIHGHASSKNGITVAAVNQVNNYTGPADVVMSSFSSWGPTDDGRIKPDISAKGVNTYSALDDSTTSYGTLSGTSMAAPSVNGTLLLLQQYYNELNSEFMRSATLRALMAHTADEAGTADGPDYRFGWGLINAERAAEVITNNELSSIIAENVLQNDETYTLSLSPQTDQPMVVTLSWTDPEGALSNGIIDDTTPVLVNDLDLRLIDSSGEVVFPWKLNPATPAAAATTGDNIVDNIEKIEILNPSGSYTLEISHKGTLLNNQQAYSLIVSGITPNDFWVSAETNAFEICEGVSALTETLDMNFAASFTGDVSLSLLNAPVGINHNFSPSSFTASGQFDLEFTNLDQLDAGVYPMTVRASSADEDYDFEIELSVLTDVFSPIVLTSPQNNANSIVQPITFEWEDDSNVNNYNFELALDEDFLNVVQQIDTPSNSVVHTDLDFSTTYYWRVKPNNQCGNGSFSEIFQFTTSCETPSNIEFIQVDSSSILFNMDDLSQSIEVEVVVQGTTPTGSGTLYDAPYEIINLSSNTCFDVYVRNICGTGFSDWVGPFEVCTTPDYCAGDNFYDTGGPDGNYQNNENWTETIFPNEDGDRVRAVFNSFNTEGCCDYLRIYNGPDINSPLLITLNGFLSPDDVSSTHPTGALTFRFTSDGSVTRQGWDVNILCEPMPACPAPPSNIVLESSAGSSLTIGWTENSDATSWEVELVQEGTSPTGNGTIVTENPYTFTGLQPLTGYRLYVRSICDDGFSDWASSPIFETGCGTIQAPYTHSAEEQVHLGDVGFCWSRNSDASNYFWTTFVSYNSNTQTGPSQARTGNKFFATNPYQNATTGNETILLTPSIDISNLTVPGLEFFTFRNGINIGSLHVDIVDENGITEDVLVLTGNFQTSAFDDWEQHIIDLSDYNGFVQARFRAVAGGSNFNEIDIDDISFKDLPDCPISPTNLDYTFTSSTIDITWADTSDATSWEVEFLPAGTSPTGIGTTVTSSGTTYSDLDSDSCFDFYVRSICTDGFSDWVGPFEVCTSPDYCAGDNFYDTGGPDANYQNGENYTETIFPDEDGDRVRAVFNSFNTEGCCDFLRVYNGPTIDSPLLVTLNGNLSPDDISSTHPTGALTFRFTSDGSVTRQGWDVDIWCEPMPACPSPPSNFFISAITGTSLTIGWTENSDATSWEVELVQQGSSPIGNGTVVTENPYTFTDLQPETAYQLYVRSICEDGFSDWASSDFFETGCSAILAPYTHSAEEQVHLGDIGFCWSRNSDASNYFWTTFVSYNSNTQTGPSQARTGNKFFATNPYQNATTGNETTLFTPSIDISNLTAPGLEFFTFRNGANIGSLHVDIVDENGITEDVLVLTGNFQSSAFDDWEKHVIDLSAYSGIVQARFRGVAGGSNFNEIDIDDISFKDLPACPSPPTNLFLESFSSSTLTVGWTENGSATSWEVELVEEGGSPAGNASVVTENPFTFTDLQPETSYQLYVRSICEDGFSDWATSTVFETTCEAILAPYTHSAEEQLLFEDVDFCWSSESNTATYSWTTYFNYNYNTPTGPSQARTGTNFFATARSGFTNTENETTLITPLIDISNLTSPGLEFYTFRNGINIGALHVDIIDENGVTSDVLVLTGNFQTSAFDDWQKHVIDLSSYSGDVQARFRAISGGINLNEIDIDDVSFKDLPDCPFEPAELDYTATSSSVDISWIENGDATSWEVEFLPAGTSPTGEGETITANPLIYDDLPSDTCFDFYIRSICSAGFTEWVGPFEVCTTSNYCAGDNFYDTGGPDGNYQNNENWIETISPEEDGDRIRAVFNSFNIESGWDYLRVYDGPNVSSPLLITLTGMLNPEDIISTHTTGSLTFWFTSDGSITRPGWDIEIICEPAPACSFPPSSLYLDDVTSSSLTVGWTDISDATSWEVELVSAGLPPTGSGSVVSTNPATLTDLASDSCYDLYIRSMCTEGVSEWTGPFQACTSPDYCGENNFYDTGGEDGNYQNNEDWTQTIYPDADDHRVRAVFNSFNIEQGFDNLRVYDGPNTSSPLLINLTGILNPDDIISTHSTGALTFWFTSDGSVTRPGWDIEIICEPFLSVNNSEFQSAIDFYPNPVEEILYIDAHQQIEKFQLFDLKGRLLQNGKVNNEQFEVDMSNYEAGLYLIKIMNNNQTAVLKIEKK